MKAKSAQRLSAACARAAAFCALAGIAWAAAAGDTASQTTPYERMARLEQYLMAASAEIALARSAAPAAISDKATVLTLNSQGYQTAVRGTNGFTCLVERSWQAPFQSPDFWNPKVRVPICYNPAASEFVLPYSLRRTKLALAGDSKERILEEVRAAVAHNEFLSPKPGAMSFMMSKDGRLADTDGPWHSHLMFHVPKATGATWGANLSGSPVVVDDRDAPEPQTIFMVMVSRWSDGTAAPIP
jgi:hypothetical protein